VVVIFVGFLLHMAGMNLGAAAEGAGPAAECRWKMGAMLLVAAVIVALAFWLPAGLMDLVQKSAAILGHSQ